MDMQDHHIADSELIDDTMNTQTSAPAKKKRKNRKKKGGKKTLESHTPAADTDPDDINHNPTLSAFREGDSVSKLASSTSAPPPVNSDSSATPPTTVKIGPQIELRSITRSLAMEPCAKEQDDSLGTKNTISTKEELKNNEKETIGTWIKDQALFSTSNIPAGTRIITEAPLIALRATSRNINNIYSKFLSLTPTQQSAFMDLEPAAAPQYNGLTTLIDQLIEHYLPMQAKVERGEDMAGREHYIYEELGRRIQHLILLWRVAIRFHAHSHSLTNKPVAQREHIPTDIPVTGVFLIISRLSHSCMPNCQATYNPSTGRMNIHTIRPIIPGECLTITFIANHIWYQGFKTRTKMLAEISRYSCLCPACDPNHPDYRRQERLRSKLYLNTVFIQTFLTSLDARENPAPYRMALQPEGGYTSSLTNNATEDPEFNDAERKLIENIRILQDLGCHDTELSRWRNALIEVVYPYFNQSDKALAQAKIAFEEGVKCWGRDHPDIGPLERGLRAAEKVVENRLNAKEKEQAEIRRKLMEQGRTPWKRGPR